MLKILSGDGDTACEGSHGRVRWEDRGVPAGPPELGVMGRHPRGVREEPCRRERREQQMQKLEQKWPGAGAATRSLDQFHVMLFVTRKKAAGGHRKPRETNSRHPVLGIPGVIRRTSLISTCKYTV